MKLFVKEKLQTPLWALSLASKMIIHSNIVMAQPKHPDPTQYSWDGERNLEHTALLFSDAAFKASSRQSPFGSAVFLWISCLQVLEKVQELSPLKRWK